ncbi:MAG: LytR cell envelope-related transcriptional attenuator [Actinomycetota bacterium]|nr:LytR cell envelope-related transcriptional attenuator [Actinomycetota bacterium]
MGKHSSPEQGPFYRSFVAWLFPWILIGIFVLVAVWVAVDVVGKDDATIPVAKSSRSAPEEQSSSEPVVSETPMPVVSATPEPEGSNDPGDGGSSKPLITRDITIQVLNGTAATEVDDRMADRLSSLGFEVVAVQGSSKQYPQTTVYYSFPDAREAAERLAAKFGWLVDAKPSNLSSTVDIHVVVGSDEV